MKAKEITNLIRGDLEYFDSTTPAVEILTGDIKVEDDSAVMTVAVNGVEYEITVKPTERTRSYQIVFTVAVQAENRLEAVNKARAMVNGREEDSALEVIEGCDCSRVRKRMACDECGYPFSEALWDTDCKTPHDCTVHGSVD